VDLQAHSPQLSNKENIHKATQGDRVRASSFPLSIFRQEIKFKFLFLQSKLTQGNGADLHQ